MLWELLPSYKVARVLGHLQIPPPTPEQREEEAALMLKSLQLEVLLEPDLDRVFLRGVPASDLEKARRVALDYIYHDYHCALTVVKSGHWPLEGRGTFDVHTGCPCRKGKVGL